MKELATLYNDCLGRERIQDSLMEAEVVSMSAKIGIRINIKNIT